MAVPLLIGGAQAAHADVIGTPSQQLTSLWTYVTDEPCAAMSVQTASGGPDFPVQFWDTAVAAARASGGSLSWSASLGGWLSISINENPDCQTNYVLGSGDFEVAGYAYVWNAQYNEWLVCEQAPSDVANTRWDRDTNLGPEWGFMFHNDLGSGYCGRGWYYSNGDSAAFENGAWVGYEPYYQNAGNSGPIWML